MPFDPSTSSGTAGTSASPSTGTSTLRQAQGPQAQGPWVGKLSPSTSTSVSSASTQPFDRW